MNAFIHGKHPCGAKGERKTDPQEPPTFKHGFSLGAWKETEQKESEVKQENPARAGPQGSQWGALDKGRVSL